MPRFYFHLYQGGNMLADPEGVELPDHTGVCAQAISVARDLIAADVVSGVIDLGMRLRVVDESDALVVDLTFSDAVAFVSTTTR